MRKLLNTIYVTDEKAFLGLEGETLGHQLEGKKTRRSIPRHSIVKRLKVNKMKNLKAARGKGFLTNKKTSTSLTADFS